MNFLKFGFFTVLFAVALFATSCGGDSDAHNEDGDTQEQHDGEEHSEAGMDGKEYTSAYVCQMHCKDSGSDVEGKCPVCGMDYVANEAHNEDSHEH